MSEKPILFSAPMIRAILAGRKTQTRRVGKLQSPEYVELSMEYSNHATKGLELIATYAAFPGRGTARWGIYACPYGIPGDRLWVRETFLNNAIDGCAPVYFYRADDEEKPASRNWKPSIFMPRSASRITLEITNIRVERLHYISENDAAEEGVKPDWRDKLAAESCRDDKARFYSIAFGKLWSSIHGLDSWQANPWVWVIDFKQVFNNTVLGHSAKTIRSAKRTARRDQ